MRTPPTAYSCVKRICTQLVVILFVHYSACIALNGIKFEESSMVSGRVLIATSNMQPSGMSPAVYKSTLDAVRAGLSCYVQQHDYGMRIVTHHDTKSSGYPHHVKVDTMKSILRENNTEVDWILWMDADARIMNYNFSVRNLIGRAGNDTHVISIFQDAKCNIINNGYLIRNSAVGRSFLELWNTFALLRHDAPYFDQIGFVAALTRLIQQHNKSNTETLESFTNRFKDVDQYAFAWKYVMEEFRSVIRSASVSTDGYSDNDLSGTNRNKAIVSCTGDVDGPVQVGPIYFTPAYPYNGVSLTNNTQQTGDDILGYCDKAANNTVKIFSAINKTITIRKHHNEILLTSEPAKETRRFFRENVTLPFFVHSKYNTFCCKFTKAKCTGYKFIQQVYTESVQRSCSSDDYSALVAPANRFSTSDWHRVCYAIWGYNNF